MNFDFFNTNPIDSFLFESFSTNTKKDIESKFIKINLKPGEKIFQCSKE